MGGESWRKNERRGVVDPLNTFIVVTLGILIVQLVQGWPQVSQVPVGRAHKEIWCPFELNGKTVALYED